MSCRAGGVSIRFCTEYWEVVSTRAAALASAVAQFERSEVERVAAANAQFDRAEAALSGPDASAAPQADIGQAPPPTVIQPSPTQPSPTQPSPTASLPQAALREKGISARKYRILHVKPLRIENRYHTEGPAVALAPLPAGAQFLNMLFTA